MDHPKERSRFDQDTRHLLVEQMKDWAMVAGSMHAVYDVLERNTWLTEEEEKKIRYCASNGSIGWPLETLREIQKSKTGYRRFTLVDWDCVLKDPDMRFITHCLNMDFTPPP